MSSVIQVKKGVKRGRKGKQRPRARVKLVWQHPFYARFTVTPVLHLVNARVKLA
jgi:hypothetical protein